MKEERRGCAAMPNENLFSSNTSVQRKWVLKLLEQVRNQP